MVWSDNFYRLFGYAPEEVVPSHELFLTHVHGEDRDRVAAAMRCLDSENECEPVELRIVRRDGAERRLFDTMAAFSHEGEGLRRRVGSVQDVTERKRLEAELTHRALHDPLTGLPNRRLLLDRLDHALERNARAGERVALLLADIDDFKAINDGLGHEAGDQLLVRIAPRLVAAMRESDTVGRFGGDEFVVICEGLKDPQDAVALAERFATAWSEPFEIAGELLSVTASAGVALAAPHDDSAALLRRADAAMYRDRTTATVRRPRSAAAGDVRRRAGLRAPR